MTRHLATLRALQGALLSARRGSRGFRNSPQFDSVAGRRSTPLAVAFYAALMTLLRLLRVIVTPAVYPRLVEFLHFDIQSTGQKSHCVNTTFWPSQCYVLIRQSDSPCPYQF